MIKASAGGGGKGMRLVEREEDLASAFRGARSEAAASFADDAVYLEKRIVDPRHVEIQILGDHHGKVVSLGERECSMQRRHQKVVEEAPSPVVTPDLRSAMGEAAVTAAQAVGYTNARAQLRIAEGRPLGAEFDDVQPSGHAFEVRIYAEDPYQGFVPSPGVIEQLRWPEGPGVRTDAGVYEGAEVSIYYDPLLAKLITWGRDREEALQRLERALAEMRIEGIRTTKPLFQALLVDDDFRAGRLDIGMLDRKLANGELRPPPATTMRDLPLVAAAIEHAERSARRTATAATPAGRRSNWHDAGRRESLQGGRWS
jgi:acetyl/propionyl-CoA carboxylase alpha subunit